MAELAACTAAVVVVYRLAKSIEPTLLTLKHAVGDVLVVDNTESSHRPLAELSSSLGVAYLHNGNSGGLAGAYNVALKHLLRPGSQAQLVVFLDEDSDPASLHHLLRDDSSQQALSCTDTAAVAPAYRDRATGMRGKYMRLSRYKLCFHPREFGDLREVAFVINSMTVWRMRALRQIGAFNEVLGVDHVDTEYCLRARQQGLVLYVNGSFEFAHSIGNRTKYRFLGRQLQSGGHSPARRYMIARNTVWVARSWCIREPAFAMLCMARLAYEAVGILMSEDDVAAKLAALIKGAASGMFSSGKSA